MSASSIYDPRESRRRPPPPQETLQDPQVGRAQAALQSCRCHAREVACALLERSLLFLPPVLWGSCDRAAPVFTAKCRGLLPMPDPSAAEPGVGLRAHAGARLCDVSVL